jgi:Protein of unknown function (DUF3352)
MRRRLLALPVMAITLLASGCGGGGGGTGETTSGTVPAGASIAPESSALFVYANTDFESEQWMQAVALFDQFPGGDELLARADEELEGVELQEIADALGPETDLVLLDYEQGREGVILMTKPPDPAKLQALLAKGGGAKTAQIDGWTVIAGTQELLTAFSAERQQGVLSASQEFEDAMKGLPADALAKLFVAGGPVKAALERSLSQNGVPGDLDSAVGRLDSIAAAAVAESDGISLSGEVAGSLTNGSETYAPELPTKLPAGALLYASFAHLDKPIKSALDAIDKAQPNFGQQLKLVEGATGLSLEGDVLPIVSQEGAVAVYPAAIGEDIPAIALVLVLDDEAKVSSLLDRLETIIRAAGQGASVTSTTVGGTPVKKIEVQGVTVYAGVFDGLLAVTNSETVITGLRGSDDRLADDPQYTQAAENADLPDEVLGLVYTNLHDGLPAVFSLAEREGKTVPSEARDNTEPLQSALLWGTSDEEGFPFGGFLTIQ